MPHIHARRLSRHRPALAAALGATAATAAIALAAAGCAAPAPADEPPEPTATLLSAPWTVEPEAQATPSPFVAPLTASDVQATADIVALATSLSATVAALASPAATSEPAVAVNTAVPIAGCGVPTVPPAVQVDLGDAGAGASAAAWASAPQSFEGDVAASDDGGATTHVRTSRDGAPIDLTIRTVVPLPLSAGRHVHVIWHDERATMANGGPGRGYALFVRDDDGPVALIVASSGPPAFSQPLLAGERGGFTVQQLRSPCATAVEECGSSLFAAPSTFGLGEATLMLGPGAAGVLSPGNGGPDYDIHLYTSHIVVANEATCADGITWGLSYGIVRK
ncbi:MAG: hypothetical protein ABI780_11140 [Ardenticatenales bacterium]